VVTGHRNRIYTGGASVKIWIDKLAPASIRTFLLSEDSVAEELSLPRPEITLDANGWPSSARWKGMENPLFTGEIGKFLSLESLAEPRIEADIWSEKDSLRRSERIAQSTRQTTATASGTVTKTETPFSLVYMQTFTHPRLQNSWRRVEVYKNEPRVRVTVHLYRLSMPNTEIFYIEFPMAETGAFPLTSNGGVAFRPYLDQIPGTCTDFFSIDGCVNYSSKEGSLLWSSRDAALISFAAPQLAAKRRTPPGNMNRILAMVYNNCWEENFLNDCVGDMEFQFDLVWKTKPLSAKDAFQITRTLNLPPLVMLNPATREDPFTFERMNEIK
jgi:hypothetical protein